MQTLDTWLEVSESRIGARPFLQYHDLGRSLLIEEPRAAARRIRAQEAARRARAAPQERADALTQV